MSCSSTCGGACCAVFYYPAPPEELRARWKDNEPTSERGKRQKRDDLYIADMLIPLGIDDAVERAEKFGVQQVYDDWPGPLAVYTCKHWDEETRLCGAYDERPDMCADYPYAKPCEHGCGYESPPNIITKWLAIGVEREVREDERRAENSNPSP